MSGWAIVAVLGGLAAVLVIVLLVIIAKAVRRTTENAGLLMEALADVRRTTEVLADLETQSERVSQVATEAASALRDYQVSEPDDGHGPNGR